MCCRCRSRAKGYAKTAPGVGRKIGNGSPASLTANSGTNLAKDLSTDCEPDLEFGRQNVWIVVDDNDSLFHAAPHQTLPIFPRAGVTRRRVLPAGPLGGQSKAEALEASNAVFFKAVDQCSAPSKEDLTKEKVDARFKEVLDFCRRARLFDAHLLLEELLQSSDEAEQMLARKKLSSQPLLCKLQKVHGWLKDAIRVTMGPAMRQEVTWTTIELKDPKIAEDFRLDFSLRQAEASEFETGGPSSQVLVRGRIHNFPLSLERFMLMQTEVDLARKEWIKDCESVSGWPGGELQLFGVLVQVLLAPSLLPFRMQETFLRHFAVCEKAPFSSGSVTESGPGVVVMESNPPEGVSQYEGWTLPGSAHRRAISLRGTLKTFFVTPSADPNSVDLIAAARIGIPIRPFMLPLELLKRVFADMMKESFVRLKEQVINRWQDYDFDHRRAACPGFYEQFREIQQRSRKTPEP